MIYTTLNKIREHEPCTDSWEQLLKSLDKTKTDDEPLSMLYILDELGLDDCLWATRSLPEYDKEWRLLACDYAERVLPLHEKEFPDDDQAANCIRVARKFAIGAASQKDLDSAWTAAWTVAWDARVAGDAKAAGAAARAAAGDVRDAARAAARDARTAARDAEKYWQEAKLRDVLEQEGEKS